MFNEGSFHTLLLEPERAVTCLLAWSACRLEPRLASKRSCCLMIMNAVCLLDVLSGSLSTCSAQVAVTLVRGGSRRQKREAVLDVWSRTLCSNNVFVPPEISASSLDPLQIVVVVNFCTIPPHVLLKGIQEALRNTFQSFTEEALVSGLMNKSINGRGTAHRVINKTLKESFQMWLYLGPSSPGSKQPRTPLPRPAL